MNAILTTMTVVYRHSHQTWLQYASLLFLPAGGITCWYHQHSTRLLIFPITSPATMCWCTTKTDAVLPKAIDESHISNHSQLRTRHWLWKGRGNCKVRMRLLRWMVKLGPHGVILPMGPIRTTGSMWDTDHLVTLHCICNLHCHFSGLLQQSYSLFLDEFLSLDRRIEGIVLKTCRYLRRLEMVSSTTKHWESEMHLTAWFRRRKLIKDIVHLFFF